MNIWHGANDALRIPRRGMPSEKIVVTVGTWHAGPHADPGGAAHQCPNRGSAVDVLGWQLAPPALRPSGYHELFGQRTRGTNFSLQDVRDPQMSFNLAWFGHEFREKEWNASQARSCAATDSFDSSEAIRTTTCWRCLTIRSRVTIRAPVNPCTSGALMVRQ